MTPPRPPVDLNPASAIRRHAHERPNHVVVRYAGGDLSYSALDKRAGRLAAVLREGGTTAGDRVAYLGLNSTSFLVTMLATFRLGAIFVPVNSRLAGSELSGVLAPSGATTLVAEQCHRELVDGVRDGIPVKRFLLVDDDPEIPVQPIDAEWEAWSGLLDGATGVDEVVARTEDDPAVLMFTSGTTGVPKGVTLTHGNLWWNGLNVDSRLDTRRGDTTHVAAPMFHIGALNSFLLRTIVRGGTAVVRRSFEPSQFAADLAEHEVSTFFAVPAMLSALAGVDGFFGTPLPHLHSIVVAGAPVPPSLIARYAEHGLLLQQAWGLTETAPFATHLPAEWTLDKQGSAGTPMPYTEVRVVDAATGEQMPAGERGEVVVRGPNVTVGYWENEQATADAFDDEGWFHSGDIGYLDDDGCLFIVDRLKDMIITGGENVYPAEVERALADLPGLVDVAVVGRADEQWGELVVAVVSVAEGVELGLEELQEHARARVARYKVPRALQIVDDVPRNAAGKLDKIAIRRLATEEPA